MYNRKGPVLLTYNKEGSFRLISYTIYTSKKLVQPQTWNISYWNEFLEYLSLRYFETRRFYRGGFQRVRKIEFLWGCRVANFGALPASLFSDIPGQFQNLYPGYSDQQNPRRGKHGSPSTHESCIWVQLVNSTYQMIKFHFLIRQKCFIVYLCCQRGSQSHKHWQRMIYQAFNSRFTKKLAV